MKTRYLLIAGVALCVSMPALAQTSGGELDDIVVTAQRRAENAQDVPIAISTVSSEQLQASGIVSTADLGTVVSGFNVGATASYFSPRVRGVGTSFFGPAVENPVALYIDDVYFSSQLMAPSELSDLEQVTVLKGPQGTLFGRNATGGVIQMRTRGPKDVFEADVNTELDQYLTSRSNIFIGGPITDTIKASIFARYTTQEEGWGKNINPASADFGEDVYKIDSDFFGRGKIEWAPTDSTAIKLSGDYAKRHDRNGINLRMAIDQPAGSTGGFFEGIGTTIQTDNPHDVANSFITRQHYEGGGGSLAIEQGLGFADLISITAYRELKFSSLGDTDNSPALLFNTGFTQWSTQFTQELRLQSNEDSHIKWSVGGYYYQGKDTVHLDLDFYNASGDSVNTTIAPVGEVYPFSPSFPRARYGDFAGFVFCGYDVAFCPGGVSPDRSQNLYFNTLRTKSWAVFAEVTVPLFNDTTRVTGGIRYTRDKRSIDGNVFTLTTTGATVNSVLEQASPSFTDGELTWRASVDHDLGDNVLGYASYNRGYKSGGYNGNDNPARVPGPSSIFPYAPYKAETVDAFEAGVKADLFGRRLRVNPAVFYSKYTNPQVNTVDLTTITAANAGGLDLYGVDLDMEWRATQGLTFTFGVEWMKTELKDFPNASLSSPMPGGGAINGVGSADGNKLPFAPELTFNVGVNYTAEIAGSKVDFHVVNAYNDGFFFEVDNVAAQRSFNMLNASVTWHSPSDDLAISLFGRNLLDEAVAQQGGATFPVGYVASYNTPPLTYGFSVRKSFGGK